MPKVNKAAEYAHRVIKLAGISDTLARQLIGVFFFLLTPQTEITLSQPYLEMYHVCVREIENKILIVEDTLRKPIKLKDMTACSRLAETVKTTWRQLQCK